MPQFIDDGKRYALESPTFAPNAGAFLWNRRMMIQATCRGYAVAQFMQPEPAKYAHVPTLAGTSFMQPEQPYFAHHPGRFFYLRDDDSGDLFSAPYEPTRAALDVFEFAPGLSDIRWRAARGGIEVALELTLSESEVLEVWTATVSNRSDRARKVSLVPYFPVGYSSWMNMSADYEPELRGVVASCIAPYQKVEDYFKRFEWKDLTYLISDREPNSWEACQAAFEGEGGIHNPDALRQPKLACGDARYEIPACIMQFALELAPGASETIRFVFGPAKDRAEIAAQRARFLENPASLRAEASSYSEYVASGHGSLHVHTADGHFNDFVNHWLPRQVFYHGDTNRLCTDPQTRNYLQDAMGMAFIKPEVTRAALVRALSQQKAKGEMPDGILLYEGAQLKYINQIPHTDHGVWLAICLQAYLNETGDYAFLDQRIRFQDTEEMATIYEHLCRAMDWLIQARDARGLSYIAQGDWCDPMNMVGYKGKGVSGWLTEALGYALQLFAPYCRFKDDAARADRYLALAEEIKEILNRHLWDGDWYGRGITDDDVIFGVSKDPEGRIYLNAQSWALLCGAPDADQQAKMIAAIDEQLATPYGIQMFAPAYSKMRDDVGRVTQKFPGAAENGSVYNHAAAFYAASLYHVGRSDAAYQVLRRMIPGPGEEDLRQRGQMPVYIPNYYRGAYRQHPRAAGRSSQLFNTGTASWFYRLLIEQLFGLRGEAVGLRVSPQLPSAWTTARATRRFRGATFEVSYVRDAGIRKATVSVNGKPLPEPLIREIQPGATYDVEVALPFAR